MPFNDLEYEELIKGLTDNFNTLADEVQLLSDRKTILEHKLRFAHEQYQTLADKYAPGDSDISSTLAKLQLPPDLQISSPDRAGFVPLPQRKQTSPKLQTAIVIRDGRRAAQRLATLAGKSTGSTVSGRSISTSSKSRFSTSLSTVLEQDFTVPGKKGSLSCPFSPPETRSQPRMNTQGTPLLVAGEIEPPSSMEDRTPHQSSDPICAAMYAETTSSAPPSASGSAAKCPIRYLDQHSPEEVARYFETHKHEIPRSHEICVKRYQRNEDDIRKLDAKYGNLVSMIQGLGQKHQPMLPSKEEEEAIEADIEAEHVSNDRVEDWAQNVSADGIEHDENIVPGDEDDRESRFDRPLKEIRVGESPSRPWGISVPILDPPGGQIPESPPPAPVSTEHLSRPAGKCPFGHCPQADIEDEPLPPPVQERPAGKCPFGHGARVEEASLPQEHPLGKHTFPHAAQNAREQDIASNPLSPPATQSQPAPTFIQPSAPGQVHGVPQMVFTGPVFIGYPMDQALAFMQQYSKGMQ